MLYGILTMLYELYHVTIVTYTKPNIKCQVFIPVPVVPITLLHYKFMIDYYVAELQSLQQIILAHSKIEYLRTRVTITVLKLN